MGYNMKKIVLMAFMAMVAATMFFACSKNGIDNSGAPTKTQTDTISNASLVGKWYFTVDTVRVYTNSTLTSSTPSAYFNSDYLQFNSDGTGVQLRGAASTNFTFSANSKVLDMSLAKTGNSISTQDIKGIDVSGSTVRVATIEKLTATDLVLYFTATSGNTQTTETAYLSR
jgi:hypothetical protein